MEEAMRLVVIDEIAGPFMVRVGIRPADPIPGPLRVSILVQDARGESAVGDATVIVSTSGPGTPGRVEAGNSPQHPQLYEADLWLDAAGDWKVTLDIDRPEEIVRLSRFATHTFGIKAQSENVVQDLGASKTQTLAWQLYSYILYIQAPLDWKWDKEFNQSIVDEVAAQKRRNVHVVNSLVRRIRGHWFEDRPGAGISFLETPLPDFAIKGKALQQSGYDIDIWKGEANGLSAIFERQDRPPEYSTDRAHRVLTVYIEMPSGGNWVISCVADLAESEDIKSCETIVNSVRFEWK